MSFKSLCTYQENKQKRVISTYTSAELERLVLHIDIIYSGRENRGTNTKFILDFLFYDKKFSLLICDLKLLVKVHVTHINFST